MVVSNWPTDKVEHPEVPNNPMDESAGVHTVPFCGTFYMEQEDFQEEGEKGTTAVEPVVHKSRVADNSRCELTTCRLQASAALRARSQ